MGVGGWGEDTVLIQYINKLACELLAFSQVIWDRSGYLKRCFALPANNRHLVSSFQYLTVILHPKTVTPVVVWAVPRIYAIVCWVSISTPRLELSNRVYEHEQMKLVQRREEMSSKTTGKCLLAALRLHQDSAFQTVAVYDVIQNLRKSHFILANV